MIDNCEYFSSNVGTFSRVKKSNMGILRKFNYYN